MKLARLAGLVASSALAACSASARPAPVATEPLQETPAPPVLPATPQIDVAAARALAIHDARVTAALSRIPKIAETVADIRHLPLKHPVPATEQTQADFRRFLDTEVAKEMPPAKTAQSVRALVRLGFLKDIIDLGKTVEEAMLSQAGAYYDPETKRFYLVIVPEDESMLDVMSAHELTHALDDEYYDLGKYTDDPQHQLSNDATLVRRLVTEGEATLVMLAYEAKVAAHQDIFAAENRRTEQAMVATFASLDSEKLAKAATDNPSVLAQMGPEMKASIEAMSSIPPFILDPLFGAYTKGCAAVGMVRDVGGWDAVGALYTSPPESTEQLLHPMEKLLTHRDHPVVLTLPPVPPFLAGLTPIDEDVVGEMTMAVYFKLWGDKTPAAEVTGWGGDRYAAFEVGGKVVAVWMTTWDTALDATRFARAYDATLPARFPGEAHRGTPKDASVTHADGTVTAFRQKGKDVLIVDGAPSSAAPGLLDWLAKSTRTQAH